MNVRRVIAIAVTGVVLMGGALFGAPSADAATGTVSGTVTTTDGQPLAGVEVFIFDDVDGPRYTCTAADGTYSFAGVDTYSTMATGPEVSPTEPCANPKFFDERGRRDRALVATFSPGGGSGGDVVDFEVAELPGERRILDRLAVAATNICYDRANFPRFERVARLYQRLYTRAEPRLSPEASALYGTVAENHFQFWIDLGTCPPRV